MDKIHVGKGLVEEFNRFVDFRIQIVTQIASDHILASLCHNDEKGYAHHLDLPCKGLRGKR